ncbi:MAG: ABC transporter ATP-binding protein [Gammaproteobacteria bacterium]|nr:ABC transporter ATP-binding protein [Gammaproteobacteria bacterium]MDP6734401.1 ABC transporter ATP-binding protein [Gammaproteobacteria bacterium]
MIKLSNLSKVYRTAYMETTALDQISIHIAKGEFVAVMGPSGCGKSTLLNVVGMIDSPSSGDYYFDGVEVGHRSENDLVDLRKQNIGFIFQNFNLIDDLSVAENVDLPLLYLGIPKKERRRKVEEALQLVGLESRAKHKPQELSGGQQQRVAVARSVVGDPKLILADEPTGNLDTKNGNDVMQMLNLLKSKGATILMVTHSPKHGQRADRIIEMLDGQVVGGDSSAKLSVVADNTTDQDTESLAAD